MKAREPTICPAIVSQGESTPCNNSSQFSTCLSSSASAPQRYLPMKTIISSISIALCLALGVSTPGRPLAPPRRTSRPLRPAPSSSSRASPRLPLGRAGRLAGNYRHRRRHCRFQLLRSGTGIRHAATGSGRSGPGCPFVNGNQLLELLRIGRPVLSLRQRLPGRLATGSCALAAAGQHGLNGSLAIECDRWSATTLPP